MDYHSDDMARKVASTLDEDIALRAILEGTSSSTGEHFFEALVETLTKTLHTYGAWVTEYIPQTRRLKALAFYLGGQFLKDYEMDIQGTPCEVVMRDLRLVHYPDKVLELFPNKSIRKIGTCSYMGVPLADLDGKILGHLAVLDRVPMPPEPRFQALFEIFAARAAAELQRLRAEAEVREREQKLNRLIGNAMDAIVELDHDLQIIGVNPAAEKAFACPAHDMTGRNLMKFLSADSCRTLTILIHDLESRPEGEQYLWIPENLQALQSSGNEFPAEATVSRYQLHGQTYYTLILRNVNDRLAAEQKIKSLTVEAEYLRQEIRALQNFDDVIGQSPQILRVLNDVHQVSGTDTTVLIVGETGTGKELIARAIHEGSPRKNKALITVNCAAIPSTLIESEFFGHEAGAFTGATKRREGRFELAEGGTIFLDEIGELSPDLQSKLLRVLQDGEFQPVGSSRTKKANVRVIAATNRNLQAMIREGRFREDLYYRIHVFPISIPPLRDRGEDVILLAKQFSERFGKKIGKKIFPPTSECIRRLKAYHWPGNVRELQNVIERAVITSTDGKLNLDRALPDVMPDSSAAPRPQHAARPLRTAKELEEVEKENLLLALETTGWRIAGKEGAASILGLKPSTLTSRMKALGVQRPKRDL
jgi:PAS domain S-box-containing protein